MNPFFETYDTTFGTIPFTKINITHYVPAVTRGIEEAKAEVDALVSNTETPTFQNVIEALESSGETLTKVTSAFFNLNSAETNDEMQAIAQEISPLLTAYGNEVAMNTGLFAKVKAVFEGDQSNLTTEQKTLLEKSYKGFSRNGANLNEADKETLKAIDSKKSKLSLTFGEHVLKESNAFQMHLTDEADLDGLPDGIREAAAAEYKLKFKNKSKSKEESDDSSGNWIFTLDYPSYIPFMTYSTRRDLRQKMHKAFGSKGFQDNENNNEDVIQELVSLRAERAALLGYESHAHYVLGERMAKSPSVVFDFLNNIQEKALPFAKKEFEELSAYAKKLDGIDQLQKWDSSYYSEKLKKEKFAIDDELLRPYFQLERVVAGVFKTAKKLFGITFHQHTDIDLYHGDVQTYEVKDENGKHLAVFYADFFPRAGKRQGAWMTSFRSQKMIEDTDQRPHVSIVCNFTKPTDSKPSLLTFNEVTTLFHEFGHALHGMLAAGTYASLSGTSVYWDFVELPSQLMENWCYEKDCLDLFAKHYETGQAIPTEYIDKIKKSANFMAGMGTIRQVGLSKIDMGFHSVKFKNKTQIQTQKTIKKIETEAIQGLDFYPEVKETITSTSFSHIFQGGYSSGYYSYKWAEVLDADAFEAFLEKGIFDRETAKSFQKNILSAGGTEHPSILYKRFRGRDAEPDALLKRAGLV
ncbi:MAG TPA: peptidase M3 [Bacteroidetes bacterium]|nr:peptidase M3 [Bacteroidota bacterium]